MSFHGGNKTMCPREADAAVARMRMGAAEDETPRFQEVQMKETEESEESEEVSLYSKLVHRGLG